ncbi:hypothetical protein DSECCO2_591080 [anaerobic digester metagenome]
MDSVMSLSKGSLRKSSAPTDYIFEGIRLIESSFTKRTYCGNCFEWHVNHHMQEQKTFHYAGNLTKSKFVVYSLGWRRI